MTKEQIEAIADLPLRELVADWLVTKDGLEDFAEHVGRKADDPAAVSEYAEARARGDALAAVLGDRLEEVAAFLIEA